MSEYIFLRKIKLIALNMEQMDMSEFMYECNQKYDVQSKIDKFSIPFGRWHIYISWLFFLAAGLVLPNLTFAEEASFQELDDVEVTGKYDRNDRAYTQENGKRFITNPYGEVESILAIAAKTKAHGTLKRVSTRKMTMPPTFVGSFINMYQHTFENGKTFCYFEGENFGALGYHVGDDSIILDVLHGSAFTSPKLWGPYDQVLGENRSSMHLLMGSGSKDGMGLLKASYAVGYTAIMDEGDYSNYGNAYVAAILDTLKIL